MYVVPPAGVCWMLRTRGENLHRCIRQAGHSSGGHRCACGHTWEIDKEQAGH